MQAEVGTASRRLAESDAIADRVLDALCGLVAARLHRTDGALTAREAVDLAIDAGLPDKEATELRAVLETAESARYAPGTDADDRQLLDRADALLGDLDRLRPEGARR